MVLGLKQIRRWSDGKDKSYESASTMQHLITALQTYCSATRANQRSVLLAPSTEAVFEWLGSNWRFEHWDIVGHEGLPGMVKPTAFLAGAYEQPPRLPRRVVLFTDQLVSAREATLEVHCDGATTFLSPLEFILNNQYHYHLYAVNGHGVRHLDPGAPIAAVLKFTMDHLHEAATLGPSWLAADQQYVRTPACRRAQRRRNIRTMQSTILGMAATHGSLWPSAADKKLETLNALYDRG